MTLEQAIILALSLTVASLPVHAVHVAQDARQRLEAGPICPICGERFRGTADGTGALILTVHVLAAHPAEALAGGWRVPSRCFDYLDAPKAESAEVISLEAERKRRSA